MRLACGCYIDSKGRTLATCAGHNGNNQRDQQAQLADTARQRAEARKTFKARTNFLNGRVRNHGATAE